LGGRELGTGGTVGVVPAERRRRGVLRVDRQRAAAEGGCLDRSLVDAVAGVGDPVDPGPDLAVDRVDGDVVPVVTEIDVEVPDQSGLAGPDRQGAQLRRGGRAGSPRRRSRVPGPGRVGSAWSEPRPVAYG